MMVMTMGPPVCLMSPPWPCYLHVWGSGLHVSVFIHWCGDMAGWPGLPVSAGCVVWPQSGLSPQWRAELRECTQWPGARDNQLSAATTDNSSRECDNNTTTRRQGEARQVASRLIVDKTVLWSLNSSCNIPQLISRHIAHPTFLILRSLAATVARAGIFKRLRLGLNTHYTHRAERLSYTKQLLSNVKVSIGTFYVERGIWQIFLHRILISMSVWQNTFSLNFVQRRHFLCLNVLKLSAGAGLWLITLAGPGPVPHNVVPDHRCGHRWVTRRPSSDVQSSDILITTIVGPSCFHPLCRRWMVPTKVSVCQSTIKIGGKASGLWRSTGRRDRARC